MKTFDPYFITRFSFFCFISSWFILSENNWIIRARRDQKYAEFDFLSFFRAINWDLLAIEKICKIVFYFLFRCVKICETCWIVSRSIYVYFYYYFMFSFVFLLPTLLCNIHAFEIVHWFVFSDKNKKQQQQYSERTKNNSENCYEIIFDANQSLWYIKIVIHISNQFQQREIFWSILFQFQEYTTLSLVDVTNMCNSHYVSHTNIFWHMKVFALSFFPLFFVPFFTFHSTNIYLFFFWFAVIKFILLQRWNV